MCIGITVLTMPPTVAALGYLSWFQGQSLYSDYLFENSSPRESRSFGWVATFTGMASVPLVYHLQATALFPLVESGSKDAEELQRQALQRRPHHLPKVSTQAQTGYVPPESMMQLVKQVGPPLVLRIAATSFSFFVAGAVQVQVAQWIS